MSVQLAQLSKVWSSCSRCPLHTGRKRACIGTGPADARLLVIGESPDRHDNESGAPFSGMVGDFLRSEASAAGLDLGQAYLTHLVACHPMQGRVPMYDEMAACQPRLHALLHYIQPKAVLLLGGAPACNLLGFVGITKHRGKWKDIKWAWKGEQRTTAALATFHPGAMMPGRNPTPKDLEKFKADLKTMATHLEQ